MPNITFMIGNGFDLACGLKSSFTDTYDGYINSAPASSSDAIDRFKRAIKKDIPTWADFEMQLANYAKELDSESQLLACIRDYDAYLSDYLQHEQQEYWKQYEYLLDRNSPVLSEIGRSLTGFYSGLTKNDIQTFQRIIQYNSSVDFRFISFNYTNLLDLFIENAFKKGAVSPPQNQTYRRSGVLHIHGALGGDVTLGVDNESQLSKLSYNVSSRGKRTIIKPVFLQSYDSNRLETAEHFIQESDIICIFGLSLGDSDLTWRKELAKWLEVERDHHLVYYKHDFMGRTYHTTAITQRMDDEDNCKEEFFPLLFGDDLENEKKAEIMKQIHIPVGVSIFNIDKAILEANKAAQKKAEIKSSLEIPV